MKKKTAVKNPRVTTENKPRFAPDKSVNYKSLVTDMDGVAWWVDPETQTMRRA